jgi:hypothetical protein
MGGACNICRGNEKYIIFIGKPLGKREVVQDWVRL